MRDEYDFAHMKHGVRGKYVVREALTMTDETIREVLDRYERLLHEPGIWDAVVKQPCQTPPSAVEALRHLLTMIPTMRAMLDDIRLSTQLGDDALVRAWLDQAQPTDPFARRLSPRDLAVLMEAVEKREKLMRWLGFMQGVLYAKGLYTIDEMRAHNKPPDEPFRPRTP